MARGILWSLRATQAEATLARKGSVEDVFRLLRNITEAEVRLSADDMSAHFVPQEFEWCEKIDENARGDACMELVNQLRAVNAEYVVDQERQLVMFWLSSKEKVDLVSERYARFKKIVSNLTIYDYAAGNNKLLDVKDALSDVYGDAIVMDGERFLSSMDGLRAIEPDLWYVASPEILMH